jgi:hypothetical protein
MVDAGAACLAALVLSGRLSPSETRRTSAAAAPLRCVRPLNVRRPYSGLETQAPDLPSKGEGGFSAAAGTLQNPPQLGRLRVCFREHGDELVQLVRHALQCLLFGFPGHGNTRKLDDIIP